MPPPRSFLRDPVLLVLTAILGIAFAVYALYRQSYIGACDWYGYYEQANLFRHGHIALTTALPAATYPSIVPLGFFFIDGLILPQYPPGFPLLLAVAQWGHLEFFVTPLAGVLSVLCVYHLVKDLTDRWTGVLFAWLWAFFPIVVWGATNLMSDLVAALCLLASYLFYRRGRPALSALLLGFGVAVRPTNVLYLLPFALLLLRDRRLIRYGLWLSLPAAAYALYNYTLYGAPWRTGYVAMSNDLITEVFRQHLGFYALQTVLQCSPLVVLLAFAGFTRPRLEKIFFLLWFAIYVLFYSFWRSGGDRWWWTRFLLPAIAPVFFLAAIGFLRLREALQEKFPAARTRRRALAALYGCMAVLPVYFTAFGLYQNDLWFRQKGLIYYQVAKQTKALVRPGSYIGSVEFAGSSRIYTPNLVPFVSTHANAPALLEHVMSQGHDAYLIVEIWNKDDAIIRDLLRRFSGEKIKDLPFFGGPLPLYKLHPPAKAPGA